MRNFARTLILSFVFTIAFLIHQGFISPEIIAGRGSERVDDARPLRMLPLGTQDEFNRLKTVRSNQELAYAMMQILGGNSGNMPTVWSDGRNLDRGFALDGDSIEVLDEVEDGWGTIEVPASLMHENYSIDAYVGNMAPASPYSGSYAGYEEEVEGEWEEEEEEEAWEEEESDEAVLKLQGTITGERGKRALINGEIWAEGDWLGEYKLSRIQDTRVVFQAADGSIFTVGM